MSDAWFKCKKCGFTGPMRSFKTDRDLFQRRFIRACMHCDNRQSIGDASMSMFGQGGQFEKVHSGAS